MAKRKRRWRVNKQIRAPKVRLIGADDKQVGVMKREKAIAKSKKEGLDLVEIAPNAKPPVVKIIDFGKFKYRQEKKQKKQKKQAKSTELKEVRFSPFIADHDYEVRIGRVKEFLQEKNKVKVVCVFKGRHMGSKQFGYKLMDRVLDELGDDIRIDSKPKFYGRHLTMIISPTSNK